MHKFILFSIVLFLATMIFGQNMASKALSKAEAHQFQDNIINLEDSFTSVQKFHVEQNYPNPFNPITKINYSLPQLGFVSLKIYDLLGEEVTTLINEEKSAGTHEIEFDGSSLSSGIYIYRIQAGDFISSKKFILMK